MRDELDDFIDELEELDESRDISPRGHHYPKEKS